MCVDMNDFYLKLIPDEERHRVEGLEPFDEYEVSIWNVNAFSCPQAHTHPLLNTLMICLKITK